MTVVIAHFNGSEFIFRALESVFNQTISPTQVIVVDDGSSSAELKNLKNLQKIYGFEMLSQANKGQSAARNYGVSKASGAFICFLDQDDYFLPNHIELLLEPIGSIDDHPKVAFVFGDLWRGNEAGTVVTHSCVHDTGLQPKKRIIDIISRDLMILPSATLIKKAAFLEVGGFDPKLRGYEDDDLFLRFFKDGFASILVDKPVTFWTINTKSVSYSETMSRSRFYFYKKLLSSFPRGSLPAVFVFDHLLVQRFAFQFAADVVAAAMAHSEHFIERQARLREFRSDYLALCEIDRARMLKIQVLLFPLSTWPASTLRVMIRGVAPLKWFLGKLIHPKAFIFVNALRRARP